MKSEKARIKELRGLLQEANRAYYVDANPIMSDREFDRRLEELAELEAKHPDLADPNSPTARVGGEPIKGFRTVAHTAPMLSIDNTYNEEEVRAWALRVAKGLGHAVSGKRESASLFEDDRTGDPVEFAVDPKIDGVAISLRYENGELVRAVTRGDGQRGDDVTANVRTIRAIPLELSPKGKSKTKLPDILEIRGEVYIPLKEFERINEDREARGDEPFMNPRNACAGTLKQLDPKIVGERRLVFVA
ncbi:MAG: NAD-dependent DNA ligase LigA, partial [Planctomycetota bacterium]|nr:NAD-dependent DNA ligase LigA [Planctomycetota bacterium]